MNPSDYTFAPWGSVFGKSECETIARNIMVILKRLGDNWIPLTWEQYKEERLKDGEFTESEKRYFDIVIDYCKDPESAAMVSPMWKEITNNKNIT